MEDKNNADPLREMDSEGYRIFRGSPSSALSAIANDISEFIGAHEHVFAGSAFLSDYSGFEVFYKFGAQLTDFPELQAMIADSGIGNQIVFVPVGYSKVGLEAYSDALWFSLEGRKGLESVSVAPETNEVIVEVKEDFLRDAGSMQAL